MKSKIQKILRLSVEKLVKTGEILPESVPDSIHVENPRRAGQGDYATGVALSMARANNCNPRELASLIQMNIPSASFVEKSEVAGPGFINFYLSHSALTDQVREILDLGEQFGKTKQDCADRILVEFVSANPNGPLHVGHGRGAAFGDALARLLRAAGNHVDTEYYVNDLGRQMDILSISVWFRYLQLHGYDVSLPDGGYQGDYIKDSARSLQQREGKLLVISDVEQFAIRCDDKDETLTELIRLSKRALGDDSFQRIRESVLHEMIEMIREDLGAFGVVHDRWFYESKVSKRGDVERTVQLLQDRGYLYESEGATWFRSSDFGDEKDRVLVRSNGDLTYFASDVAYHLDKLGRNYRYIINVWGADHHGYVARMKAALQAVGEDPDRLRILLVQFASLYRDSTKISMSTRAGEFVSLKELVQETGSDAARFFYILRKSEQHLDFNLELAKQQTSENPVYYVQYAHARICSVFRQMQERGIGRTVKSDPTLLTQSAELDLLRRLSRFPEIIQSSAHDCEPHQVAYYLRDVATDFHSFYNRERILDCEDSLRCARLDLIDAARQVLANGLEILGVSAPESM